MTAERARIRSIDRVGQKFNRLTVLRLIEKRPGEVNVRAVVRCECGMEAEVLLYLVVRGTTKSCGCLKDEHNTKLRIAATQRIELAHAIRDVWGTGEGDPESDPANFRASRAAK